MEHPMRTNEEGVAGDLCSTRSWIRGHGMKPIEGWICLKLDWTEHGYRIEGRKWTMDWI